MTAARIVVVEDEEDIRDLLAYALGREGFAITGVGSGATGLDEVRRSLPDLVLLDLMLPDIDGLEVCRQLKEDEATQGIPLIMVTAKGEEADVVLGLGLGADDYITKPFRKHELVARTKAVLRRAQRDSAGADEQGIIVHQELRIDPRRHKVWDRDRELALTATEFRILHFLASHPGRIFTRNQILTRTRGELVSAFDRSVDAHIRSVRKKLGDRRDLIETVHSVGYRFAELSASP